MGELTYDMNTGNISVSVELNDLPCTKASNYTGYSEDIYVNYPNTKTFPSINLSNVDWGLKDWSPGVWTKSDWSWLQLACNASNFTQKFDFTWEHYHLPTIFGTKEIKKVEINKRFYI